jgi:hypothetical protein
MNAEIEDDDLVRFEAHGAGPLPAADIEGWLDHDGARIWHASYGDGPPVVMMHGGLGHAGNWSFQVPAVLSAGTKSPLGSWRAGVPAASTPLKYRAAYPE